MRLSFSQSGDVAAWSRHSLDHRVLPLRHRHKSLIDGIRQTVACSGEWLTSRPEQLDEVRAMLRGKCKRVLGIEREIWTRSGRSGNPPSFSIPRTQDFATTQTAEDIVDDAFLPQHELNAIRRRIRRGEAETKPEHHHDAPDSVEKDVEEYITEIVEVIRQDGLRALLAHHKPEIGYGDDIDRSDELWEKGNNRPLRGSPRSWRRARPPHDAEGEEDGILSRYLEGRR